MKHFLLLFFCLTNLALVAQNPSQSSVQVDSTRRFNTEHLNKLLESNDFNYGTRPPVETSGIWEWILKKIASLFGKSLQVDYLWETISVIIVLIALYFLLRMGSFGLFRNDNTPAKLHITTTNNHIYEQDLDALLQAAIQQQHYRDAIRLLHLKLLRNLSDKKLIAWKLDKTNYQYYTEINDAQISKQFRSLSSLYEYIWYGDFGMSEQHFEEANSEFETAFTTLLTTKLKTKI